MEVHITRFADTKATKDSAKLYMYITYMYTLVRGKLNIERFQSTVVKAHSVCCIKSASK